MSQLLPQFFHHKIDALCFIFLSLNLFCTEFVCPPVLCPWATHSMACYSILVILIAQERFVEIAEMKNHRQNKAVLSRLAALGPVTLGSEHAVESPEPKHCHKGDKYLLWFILVVFLSVRWFALVVEQPRWAGGGVNVANPHLATGLKEDCGSGNNTLNSLCHLFWLLFDEVDFPEYS